MRKILSGFLITIICMSIYSCSKSKNDVKKEEENEKPVTYEGIQKRSEKRGVSYGFQLMEDVELLAPGVSWFYNWANDIPAALDAAVTAKGMDYYPMTWNGSFSVDRIKAYKQKHPNCQYILAYNEPNLTDQANMTPQQAAAIFPAVKALATELNMKIISPAMNYGTLAGYSDPIKWLDEFFALVPISNFDGIAIHCYMSVPSSFKSYVRRFKKYNKPIWMTEFCAWEQNISNVSQQMKYMSEVVNYMESSPDVFRYAWFIPRNSGSIDTYPFMQLLTKSKPYQLSDLGKVYINMSTLDKTVYYDLNQVIPAAHYSSLNMIESVNSDSWTSSVSVRPTTDVSGIIDVFGFSKDMWLEYQINVPADGGYNLELRYSTYADASLDLLIDGTNNKSIDLPNTGVENTWKTLKTGLTLQKGKHTIRLKMTKAFTALNWLRFN